MEYIVIFGHDRSESKLRHQPAGERINNRPREPAIQNNFGQRVAGGYSSSARLQLAKVLTAGDLKKPEHKGVIPGKVFCAPFASDLALRARRKITCSDKIRVYGEAIAR